ncbi:MAG: prepilin-type N-terminal cleavage/methylation domain-containing protein [Nitrospinales bacterium]|jgi:prepilin-type N-terminal cleavage/methylation domain-containing protein
MEILKNHKGFTLVELVFVILCLGILSAVAIPSFDRSSITATLSAHTVQTDVKYIQDLAMTRNQNVTIEFLAGAKSYMVTGDPGGVYPAEMRELPQGATILANITIDFNSAGEPSSADYITLVSGSETATVAIEQFTGRATVS